MGRYKQASGGKGSQKWLQIMVNQCPERLNELIDNALDSSANHDSSSSITWCQHRLKIPQKNRPQFPTKIGSSFPIFIGIKFPRHMFA